MVELTDKILEKITPAKNWSKISRKDYERYGVSNVQEAKVVACYKTDAFYGVDNVVTLYQYGDDASFINELAESYSSLQTSIEQQKEYGICPKHWEMFGINQFYSVIKLIHNPIVNIVDIFFVYKGMVYSFHTYLPSEEKHLKLAAIMRKNSDINYIIKVINELKD